MKVEIKYSTINTIVIWGAYSVSNATLNRFFSLHYLLPFLLAALVVAHLIALHTHGLVKFGPYFTYMKSLARPSTIPSTITLYSSNYPDSQILPQLINKCVLPYEWVYSFNSPTDDGVSKMFLSPLGLRGGGKVYILYVLLIRVLMKKTKKTKWVGFIRGKIILAFILPNYSPKTRIGPHNEDVYSVLVGSILGDCLADRSLSGGVRFIYKQSVIHQDYLFWLFDFFRTRGYCSNNLPVKFTIKLGDKLQDCYRFNTYAFSSLLDLYKSFYNSNKKKVIPNNIEELLTPLALAIWIMDVGTFKSPGLRIASNCFTKQEVELLVKALENKFNIKSSLHKNNANYQLYIKSESMPLLKKLVLPYVVPSMRYKLGIKN